MDNFETIEQVDTQIAAVRGDKTLTDERQGKKLDPLYRQKHELLTRERGATPAHPPS